MYWCMVTTSKARQKFYQQLCINNTTSFMAPLLGQKWWACTRRNIHPFTPIMIVNQPLSASFIYYDPWHSPCSSYVPDSLFCTIFVQVLFGLPLGLAPSTSYSIHFFTQSLSSFHNTCPSIASFFAAVPMVCHLFLVSLSLSEHFTQNFIIYLNITHGHLTILITARWRAISFLSL